MNPPILRRMEPADVADVAVLERSIFADAWPDLAFEREIQETSVSWPRVAVDPATGEILAYLVAWFVADEAHLANIAVAPRARRRGLAQALLDEFVEEARRRDARMALLEVRRTNDAARAFYEKNGFYVMKIRPRYYRDNGEDAFVMVLPLSEAGRLPAERGVS